MNFSVVIVTYNRIQLLKECLECLYNQSVPFYEIIVIDNCSTDGTEAFLSSQASGHDNLRVYRMPNNLGGAGGFVAGLGKISDNSDYTLIIDDDAMVSHDYLEQICNHMEDNILAYSGTVKTGGKIDSSHRRRLSNPWLMLKSDVPIEEYQNEYFDYDFSTFCGVVVNSDLIRKIGFPMQEYFIWYDDSEYSLRIRRHTAIRNINSAVLDHKTKPTKRNDRLGWKSYYGYRNQWDMGLRYSRSKILFGGYRLAFHICRMLQFAVRHILCAGRDSYYKYMVGLHKDVIYSVMRKELGRNEKYHP